MGIIKAFFDAVGGNLADQWAEVIEADNMSDTTVFTKGLGHHNLTSMWSASERDAVYHIREAIEEIVRDHVTVERGRIYNLAWYEK